MAATAALVANLKMMNTKMKTIALFVPFAPGVELCVRLLSSPVRIPLVSSADLAQRMPVRQLQVGLFEILQKYL